MRVLSGPSNKVRVETLSFSGNQLIAGTTDRTVLQWESGTDRLDVVFKYDESLGASQFAPRHAINMAEMSPDGREFVAACPWWPGLTVRDHEQNFQVKSTWCSWATGFAFASDGSLFVSYNASKEDSIGGTLRAFQPPLAVPSPPNLWAHPDKRGIDGRVAFFPDSKRFLFVRNSLTPDGYLVVSDISVCSAATGRTLLEFENGPAEAGQCKVSPDGGRCVVSGGRTCYVWDPSGGRSPIARFKNTSLKHFTDISFHPSGRFLGATSNDTTVKLYDTQSWQLARTYSWNIGRLRSIAFSPDGMLAAAGSDTGRIVVWDVEE